MSLLAGPKKEKKGKVSKCARAFVWVKMEKRFSIKNLFCLILFRHQLKMSSRKTFIQKEAKIEDLRNFAQFSLLIALIVH